MITGLDLNATVDFVLEDDRDNPTVWKLGIVGSNLFSRIHHQATDEIDVAYKYLQVALRGWENFTYPFEQVKEKFFGEEISVVPISLLTKIPGKVISKLYVKSIEITKLSDDERKN